MNFIKKLIDKYKSFLSDMVLNMIGFGIYIVSQQILLLPILAKSVDDAVYSSIVLYISVLNVICNVTGGELGNVRLIRDSEYKEKNIVGDFTRILVTISPIIAVIAMPILIYLKYSVLGSVILVLTILMANVRLYATCYYRLQKKFGKVILQNICYFVGIVISLIVFKFFNNIYLIMLIPELLSLVYALKNSDLLKMKLAKTEEIKNTYKSFSELGSVSLLTNLMNYFDKFLIYPILGSASVAVYYAVNSMAKITSLITNPMSSVILSWVSNIKKGDDKSKIFKMTLLSNIPVIFGVTILSIPLTYIALRILYFQYLDASKILIIPIALSSGFATASTLIKSVLLKFTNTKKILYSYIGYFIVFIILGYGLSKTNGLIGFTIANLASKIVLWIIFNVLLLQAKKMEEKNVRKVKE